MKNDNNTLQQLRENEKAMRKQLILQSTLTLFTEGQITDVSMRDIAQKAGISPALIYRHFKDRDELFIEAFLLKCHEMINTFGQTINHKEIKSIEGIGKEFILYLFHHPLFFEMMTYFMLDNSLIEKHIERFNMIIRDLLNIFDMGFNENGMTKNVRIHTHAFFAALNGIMITFYHYPGRNKQEIEQHIESITHLISSLFAQAK